MYHAGCVISLPSAKPLSVKWTITSRQELLEHSRQATGLSIEHNAFGLFAYMGDQYIGGIIGKIYFNWLHLDLIWVEDSHLCRQGLGKILMEQALPKAKELKLNGIEVWTQSWQAPEFYRKLGYEEFATLDDFTPSGRKRHAFRYYIIKPAAKPERLRPHLPCLK